jgi:hypothetical protein
MKKTEFFKAYGGGLASVGNDDGEYGDYLILHPEEISIAKDLEERGYTIVSVHETEDDDDDVDITQPCDYGSQPFKYGYFAINHHL